MSKLLFGDAALDVTSDGKSFEITLNGTVYRVEIAESLEGRLDLLIDGRRVVAYVSAEGETRWVTINGCTVELTKTSAARRGSSAHEGSSELAAPMPGQVRAVSIAAGEAVMKGQVLVILEAMKMEIRVQAPFDGRVASVDASVGQTVEREQVLVRLERA